MSFVDGLACCVVVLRVPFAMRTMVAGELSTTRHGLVGSSGHGVMEIVIDILCRDVLVIRLWLYLYRAVQTWLCSLRCRTCGSTSALGRLTIGLWVYRYSR